MLSSHCSRALRRLRGRTNPYVCYVVFRCVGIAALISSWRLWWFFDDDFGFLHGSCHPEVSTNLYTPSPFSGCWCGALHWCSITIITNPNNLKPDRSIYCRDVTRDSAVIALFQRVLIVFAFSHLCVLVNVGDSAVMFKSLIHSAVYSMFVCLHTDSDNTQMISPVPHMNDS